jgi:hypothetical protein
MPSGHVGGGLGSLRQPCGTGVPGSWPGEGHCGLDGKVGTHEPAHSDALQTARELGRVPMGSDNHG